MKNSQPQSKLAVEEEEVVGDIAIVIIVIMNQYIITKRKLNYKIVLNCDSIEDFFVHDRIKF
jgi:hypothetical protein